MMHWSFLTHNEIFSSPECVQIFTVFQIHCTCVRATGLPDRKDRCSSRGRLLNWLTWSPFASAMNGIPWFGDALVCVVQYGMTVLMCAAEGGLSELSRDLVERGVDIHAASKV